MCFEINGLDPAHFISTPGLARQAALKKTKVILDPLSDIVMLLMVEKGIRRGIHQAIHQYAKTKNKYMKDYDKNKESLYLNYWDENNFYRWAMLRILAVDGFKWVENTSQLNKDFIESCNKDIKYILLKLMFNILKNYVTSTMIYHFLLKE